MKGFFGNLFDFNHDGKLSTLERAADFAAYKEVVEGLDKTNRDVNESIERDFAMSEDEEQMNDELEAAGLERDELEWMDEEERTEILEDAGLDPEDFEF